jgi:hypothetical protein
MFSAPKSVGAIAGRKRALSEQRLKRAREDYEQWLKHMAMQRSLLA